MGILEGFKRFIEISSKEMELNQKKREKREKIIREQQMKNANKKYNSEKY